MEISRPKGLKRRPHISSPTRLLTPPIRQLVSRQIRPAGTKAEDPRANPVLCVWFLFRQGEECTAHISLEIISIPFSRLSPSFALANFFPAADPSDPIASNAANPIIFQLFQVDSIYFQEEIERKKKKGGRKDPWTSKPTHEKKSRMRTKRTSTRTSLLG